MSILMTLFKWKYRIESTRLQGWDYSAAGWYFVTICTRNRQCFFGDVVEGQSQVSAIGEIVADEWRKTEQVRANVKLDEWVIMPNHLHGILVINSEKEWPDVETPRRGVSTGPNTWKPNTLGSIIGQFKTVSTKRIRATGYLYFAWSPRFYDHIIRDENSLADIRLYIRENPLKWALDENHPNAVSQRNR